jgi:DMSO reductase anchor subunit
LLCERLVEGAAEPLLLPLHATASLAFGLIALTASLFHLGRPRYAYRAVLGLRHSWLSREIVAFGAFAGLASAYAGVVLASHLWPESWFAAIWPHGWTPGLGWCVAATGALGVFCSAMIYVFTGRECWSFTRVAVRFALTAALLGVAATWFSILMVAIAQPTPALLEFVRSAGPKLCRALIAIALAKLAFELAIFRHVLLGRMTPLKRSAMLLSRDLSSVTLARFALGALGGIMMPALLLTMLPGLDAGDLVQFAATTGLLFAACLVGELLERYLFFTACAAPRMPGGIR